MEQLERELKRLRATLPELQPPPRLSDADIAAYLHEHSDAEILSAWDEVPEEFKRSWKEDGGRTWTAIPPRFKAGWLAGADLIWALHVYQAQMDSTRTLLELLHADLRSAERAADAAAALRLGGLPDPAAKTRRGRPRKPKWLDPRDPSVQMTIRKWVRADAESAAPLPTSLTSDEVASALKRRAAQCDAEGRGHLGAWLRAAADAARAGDAAQAAFCALGAVQALEARIQTQLEPLAHVGVAKLQTDKRKGRRSRGVR